VAEFKRLVLVPRRPADGGQSTDAAEGNVE
jgi:hypothetical protein